MEQQGIRQDGDLVLPPSTFAYVLDSTKGKVSVHVGPYKNSLSNTDQLVVWNGTKFVNVNDTTQAIQTFVTAGEGEYVVLSNPTATTAALPSSVPSTPQPGAANDSVLLDTGRRINIAGPISFPLWPGQTAMTVPGHHLRHNQYLLTRVYDQAQAMANWSERVIAPQVPVEATGDDGTAGGLDAEQVTEPLASPTVVDVPAPSLTMGQLQIVNGTEVSFYIPPTGIEVLTTTEGGYTRNAVTLETLEYCILLDENGSKRYVQGPDVVFPHPTEHFLKGKGDDEKLRKFRAIELNPFSGVYVKVIEAYEDESGNHPVGEELFITGRDTAIYYPRREHSIVQYGDRTVHQAIALPSGEGRYLLDRTTGVVDLVTGPTMLLPDPRTHVIVNRILDDKTVELLYPGNDEAQQVNEVYREVASALLPGQHFSNSMLRGGSVGQSRAMQSALATPTAATAYSLGGNSGATRYEWEQEGAAEGVGGDVLSRSTTYGGPRTITLDNKYEGAVSINIWPGFAMMLINKTGQRRVEIGPKAVLLEYDEIPMPLSLSTGKPKTTDDLYRLAYLRIINNLVSDIITVETSDLVKLQVKVSYRVDFDQTPDVSPESWFDVDNYVKVMTDHCRSLLRNTAKKQDVLTFYNGAIDIVRDTILGVPVEGVRPGMVFKENNMQVYDVEVLSTVIEDTEIRRLFTESQAETIRGSVALTQKRTADARADEIQALALSGLDREAVLVQKRSSLALQQTQLEQAERMAVLDGELTEHVEQDKIQALTLAAEEAAGNLMVKMQRLADDARLDTETKETDLFVQRAQAMGADVVTALQNFGDKNFTGTLVEAMGPAAAALGVTTADLFLNLFSGTPFEGVFENMAKRPLAQINNSVTSPASANV